MFYLKITRQKMKERLEFVEVSLANDYKLLLLSSFGSRNRERMFAL